MFRSSVSYAGQMDAEGADYVYYNADIINNTTADVVASTGIVAPDPQIRFNETRDTALIKDASQYNFSIIRFTMDGPGLDLPLLIPTIKLGQSDPNLTTYGVGISYQQSWLTNTGTVDIALTSDLAFVYYVPENKNPVVAPIPAPPITVQDITSRYYYVSSYQSMVVMVNKAINEAYLDLYLKFVANWQPAWGAFPFTGYNTGAYSWYAVVNPPTLTFDPKSKLFSILADSDGFGTGPLPGDILPNGPIIPFTALGTSPSQSTAPTMRLFFNTNLNGLFANFYTQYYNTSSIPGFPNPVPAGFSYEIIFYDQTYQNIIDYRQPPYSQPNTTPLVPIAEQKVFYNQTQDFGSTGQLWSPIGSLVFCSALLPIKYENVGAPNVLGTGNLNGVDGTSQSAFQPIITDIAIDTSVGGSDAYRSFIYYAPQAEYRLSDFGRSHSDIRQIDIQVYWKNRLDNQLIPLTMYNLSSVSLKVMFRHKRVMPTKGSH